MNTAKKIASHAAPAPASGFFSKTEAPTERRVSEPPPGHALVPLALLERLAEAGHVALPVAMVELLLDSVASGVLDSVSEKTTINHMTSRRIVHRVHRDPKILQAHRKSIVSTLRRHGELGISDIESYTQIPRNFLVLDLEALREKGEVRKDGHKRDATYSAR